MLPPYTFKRGHRNGIVLVEKGRHPNGPAVPRLTDAQQAVSPRILGDKIPGAFYSRHFQLGCNKMHLCKTSYKLFPGAGGEINDDWGA